MNVGDISLELLAGDPIPLIDSNDENNIINIGNIHPFTIKDIKNIGGETVFNKYVGSLIIDKDRITNETNKGEVEDFANISNFELAYSICIMNEEFKKTYLDAMSFIFKENTGLCNLGFYVGDINLGKIINDNVYKKLIYIVKLQNCIERLSSGDEFNPANEKAKELLEKREKVRKELNRLKNKSDDGSNEPLTLGDLISILCANGNGINLFNVWDLSFYAFNDQFNRMTMFENYHVNVRSLLAGEDPDKIELKHWMSKID